VTNGLAERCASRVQSSATSPSSRLTSAVPTTRTPGASGERTPLRSRESSCAGVQAHVLLRRTTPHIPAPDRAGQNNGEAAASGRIRDDYSARATLPAFAYRWCASPSSRRTSGQPSAYDDTRREAGAAPGRASWSRSTTGTEALNARRSEPEQAFGALHIQSLTCKLASSRSCTDGGTRRSDDSSLCD
jgi:hypothetical protein